MEINKLSLQDKLPLTCSRTGNCCHGKMVFLNPWELYSLAKEKKNTSREFRDLYCEFGGIRLKFNGKIGWDQKEACSQYIEDFGCSVHLGRPLACRLYPLGRHIQSEKIHYIYKGSEFPCLAPCPDVVELPLLSVGEYLKGQMTEKFENAQDSYLELMQNIADVAFELLLDSGLAASGDKDTLPLWIKIGGEQPEVVADRIGVEWIDCLMIPQISDDNPMAFIAKHNELILLKIQEEFGALQTFKELHEASGLIMGIALHLARSLGANPKELAELWVNIAKSHGAQE